MKTSKKSAVLASLLFGLTLAACNNPSTPSSTDSQKSVSSSTSVPTITNNDLTKGKITYNDATGAEHHLTRSGIYKASGAPHVDSYPEDGKRQKLLVAPISFQANPDDPNASLITADDALLQKINKTFTASDEELQELSGSAITSVQSFYEKSSFGRGAFDVVVLPCWIEYNGTAKAFQNSATSGAGVSMSAYVRDWYNTEYAKTNHGSLGADWQYSWSDFDSDKDGYIDLIWQVYAYPYTSGDTSFWWAYVTYTGNQPNATNPQIMTLAWASTKFMTENFNGYDPHTFIHETGHTYGVNDYYDYNNTWRPMGTVDYMDGNLGDHNAYTKFMYGWVEPWVLREEDLEGDKEAVITLRAQTLSGDCLVLASPNYNGTAFDEYLMVELVGPYGLAKRDYMGGYTNYTGFRNPGIRITHVDARMYNSDHDAVVTDPNLLGQNGGDNRVSNTYMGRSKSGKSDTDFWPKDEGSAPASYLTKHPNAKVGTPSSYASGKYAYYTESSLMQSSISDENWTSSANYNAKDTDLFTKNARFSLKTSSGASSAWAKTFMPSGSNLWNKAKTTLGWKGNQQIYEINENYTCNYSLRVTDLKLDDTYGAIATLRISLL